MADVLISQLPVASSVNTSDLIIVDQNISGVISTKIATVAQLINAFTIGSPSITTGFLNTTTLTSGATPGYSEVLTSYNGAGGTNSSIALLTARGTIGAPGSILNGDTIGNMDYFGHTGSGFGYSASLDAVAIGNFSPTSTPSQFNFNVTAIGSTIPSLVATIGQGIVINTLTPAYYAISAMINNNVVNGTGIQLGGGRGTQTAPAAVLANDILGNIDFFGYGTSYVEGAAIDAIALSTWSGTNAESALAFFVTTAGSVTTLEKMRLSSNGELMVNVTTIPTSATTGLTTFPTTATGDTIIAGGGVLSLATESAGAYNFVGLGYSAANTNNASIGLKSQTRGTAPTSSGDTIGNIDVFGWTGTAYGYAASIDCVAAATWTSISTPSSFTVNLTPVGSVTPGQVMVVAPTGLISLIQTGGIVGSNGTTSAVVGQVGEFITAQVLTSAPVSLTTATPATITSISLTAGDWNIEGVVDYIPAATTNLGLVQYGTNSVAATIGAQDTYGADFYGAVIGANIIGEVIPKTRYLLTATTTIYLVANATFTVSTCTAAGRIVARRMR